MRIAMTGASGNMGTEALKQTIGLEDVEWIRVLLLDTKKDRRYAKRLSKLYGDKIQIVFGSVAEDAACAALHPAGAYSSTHPSPTKILSCSSK